MNWYGFFIVLGILVGCFIIEKVKKQSTINYQLSAISVFDLLPWVLIPGVLGARLYHVLDYWNYYQENPIQILYVWQGGLGIFGGIIGGLIGLGVFSTIISWREFKKKDIKILDIKILRVFKFHIPSISQFLNFSISNFLTLADLGVVGLAIGQAIGRWGNYFNQELYGLPTQLPWGIYIRPENRLAGLESFTHFHPLFLYESLGCLTIFIILVSLLRSNARVCFAWQQIVTRFSNRRRKKTKFYHKIIGACCKQENTLKFVACARKQGVIFFLYLFLYSFLRFWLEFLRPEGWEIGGIRATHIITVSLMTFSLFAMFKKSATIKRVRNHDYRTQ